MNHPDYQCPLVYPRVFGVRQCERIVAAGLQLPRESGAVAGDRADLHDATVRQAEIAWLPLDSSTDWIYRKLDAVVQRANRVYGYRLTGFTEDAQFTCYHKTGAFYDWHQDGLEGELAGRKLSMVVQLSHPEDYTGSNLELFSLSSDPEIAATWTDALRLQGSVIIFPAFEFHRVTRLLSGQRYSLVCWVGGPPFS